MAIDPHAQLVRRSHYWQLPVFVLGLVSAALAYTQFPPPPSTPHEKLARLASSLKASLERRPLDLSYLDGLAVTMAKELDQTPDHPRASEWRWLVGSVLVLSAEADPLRTERWQQADDCFAQVSPQHLATPELKKLFYYRQAKAQAALLKGDPKDLIVKLVDVPKEEPAEGERHRLLGETYLRDTPPNYKAAITELMAYLSGTTNRTPQQLAKDRLKLAQLCVQVGDSEKAEFLLKDIGTAASAEIQAASNVLRGQLLENNNRWLEAVQSYENALASQELSPEQEATVRLRVAMACERAMKPELALPHLEKVALHTGSAAQAANLLLAQFYLNHSPQTEITQQVLPRLRNAARLPASNLAHESNLLPVDRARAIFERAIDLAQAQQSFAEAVELCTLYSAFALTGRATEKKAEVNVAWAEFAQTQPELASLSVQKYAEAAADLNALATTFPTVEGKADLWKRAAKLYRLAGDETAALKTLDQLVQSPNVPADLVAAAWVEKGETLLAQRQFYAGGEALRQAMNSSSSVAATARVKLAMAQLEEAKTLLNNPSKAADGQALLQSAEQLLLASIQIPGDDPTERNAHGLALFEHGKLLLGRGNANDAEARFRQLAASPVEQSLAQQAKLYLGSTLLLAARGDGDGRNIADAETKLKEAASIFTQLSQSDDTFIRTQADIRLANTTLLLRNYVDMPELCERLATRYTDQVEELIIRSMLYTAYRFADRTEPAAATLARMEELFEKLPDDAFPGGAEEYTREYWQKQWFAPLKAKP